MKRLILPLLLITSLYAEEAPAPAAVAAAAPSLNKSVLFIESKARAADYVQAFDLLKKEKPTFKIAIRTMGGLLLNNVTELSASQNGTLLFVKILSNQGVKTQVLPVEEVLEILYS